MKPTNDQQWGKVLTRNTEQHISYVNIHGVTIEAATMVSFISFVFFWGLGLGMEWVGEAVGRSMNGKREREKQSGRNGRDGREVRMCCEEDTYFFLSL